MIDEGFGLCLPVECHDWVAESDWVTKQKREFERQAASEGVSSEVAIGNLNSST